MTVAAGWFVTGTDTGVGKTRVSLALMQRLQQQGLVVAGMKPVASGCERTARGLRNDDAVQLQAQSSIPLDYALVNPCAFEPPIAPHLAAARVGQPIDIDAIVAACARLRAGVDRIVVEGVGGWLVPLNEQATLADLAVRLGLAPVLVVGVRLGCLNHALLTAESIERHGLRLAGWVANALQPLDEALQENIRTLETRLGAELLGVLPWDPAADVKKTASCLRLPPGTHT